MSFSFGIPVAKDLNYHEILSELDVKDLVLMEQQGIGNDVKKWPEGYLHFYVDKESCRSIEIAFDGVEFTVRIFSGSSIDDYKLGLKFVETVAAKANAAIRPEDGDEMDLESFRRKYGDQWAQSHSKSALDMVFGLQKDKGGQVTLHGATSDFVVGPRFMESLENEPGNVPADFFKRFRRHQYISNEDVFVASKIVLSNQERTKKATVAILGENVPTLLPMDANAIALSSKDGKKLMVASESLATTIGNESVWLDDDSLLTAAYSGRQWKALLESMGPYELKDVLDVGTEIPKEELEQMQKDEAVESFQELFEEGEWSELIYAPFAVFLLVSAADGTINKKELKAFGNALKKQRDSFLFEILSSSSKAPNEIMSDLLANPDTVPVKLKNIVETVDRRVLQRHAISLKFALYDIGRRVAESSGGFLGFGKKIRGDEKRALVGIAGILKLAG